MLGEFATSKAGHDKDRLYMIVGEEEEWVYLCDGRLRGVEHPKKKKKKHMLVKSVTDRLELPKDMMFGVPILTITGQNDLTVENYKGILEYREDKIRLSLKQGQVEICGTHLKIEYYTGEDMKISGQIDKLEYGR